MMGRDTEERDTKGRDPAQVIRFTLVAVALGALVLAPLAARLLGNQYLLSLATTATIFALAAASLQLVVGQGGLVSFGHAAFLGIGAYAPLILGAAGWPDATLSVPVAMLASAGFALATGAVALRTRGVTFIMITLAFAQMAYFVAGALAAFGGDDGSPLDRPTLFGMPALSDRVAFHALAVTLLVATVLLLRRLVASPFGRALAASRQSEVRAIACGISVARVRLVAYTVAGALCGLAGWLLGVHSEFVSPAFMDWRNSGELLVMVILGGAATPEGAALGAIGFVLIEEVSSSMTDHWRLLVGPAIVLFVLLRRRAPRFA
jgi:branched-chain amino acid transport system permease protein